MTAVEALSSRNFLCCELRGQRKRGQTTWHICTGAAATATGQLAAAGARFLWASLLPTHHDKVAAMHCEGAGACRGDAEVAQIFALRGLAQATTDDSAHLHWCSR